MASNAPQEEPAPQQQPGNPQQQAATMNKYSAANDLMFEDCLKSIMLKSKTGKSYSSYKNKFCPKAKQSAFGDFPPGFMPKKQPIVFSQLSDSGSGNMFGSMHSIV